VATLMHANGRACARLGSVIAVDGRAIVRCGGRLDGRIEDRCELDVVRAHRGDSGDRRRRVARARPGSGSLV